MSKILIYDNPEDFLKVIGSLQEEYNKKQETITSKGGLDNE